MIEKKEGFRLDLLGGGKMTESRGSADWGLQSHTAYQWAPHISIRESRKSPPKKLSGMYSLTTPQIDEDQEEQSPVKQPQKNEKSQKLLDLQKQFNMLKQMAVADSTLFEQKCDHHLQDSLISSSQPSHVAISSSDFKSNSSYRKEQKINVKKTKQLSFAKEYENTQLESMLVNSFNKIEQLLQSEGILKRKIFELNHQLELSATKIHKDESKETVDQRQFHEQIAELQSEISHLKKQLSEQKYKNNNTTSKCQNIERQLKEKFEECKRLKQSLLLEKQKYLNEQIERKRATMEKDLVYKEKESEIAHYKRLLSEKKSYAGYVPEEIAKQLQEQLKLRDQRYQLLLKQMEELKVNNDQQLYLGMIEKLKQAESTAEQSFKIQILELKKRMEMYRNENGQQKDASKRLKELEQTMKKQEEEKKLFVEELQNFIEENHELKTQIKNLKETIQRIRTSDRPEKIQIVYKETNNSRLEEKFNIQVEKNLREELDKTKKKFKQNEDDYENEIRQLLREQDRLKFSIQKAEKEAEFKIELAAKRFQGEKEIIYLKLRDAEREREQWKGQFHRMKDFYERQLSQMRDNQKRLIQGQQEQIRNREIEVDNIKRSLEEEVRQMNTVGAAEKQKLMSQFTDLIEANEKFAMQSVRMIQMEGELLELRRKLKQTQGLNQQLDHLWAIKQNEYSNLAAVLQTLQISEK